MKAYYIHWNYPSTADDALYYSGTDDEKLFHKKENAQKYMEEKLKNFFGTKERAEILWDKEENGTLTKEENEEWQELYYVLVGDSPCSGTICEREIIFED